MPGHILNGRPDIDETGARVKSIGGAGYAPPSARDGDPRFGTFGEDCDEITDPFQTRDDYGSRYD